jgi:hypothetical protein
MPAKKQQTHAKRARELAVKEKRERKRAKKAERAAAADGVLTSEDENGVSPETPEDESGLSPETPEDESAADESAEPAVPAPVEAR